MRSADYIQGKFQSWAQRCGIELQGSEGARGAPNYTLTLEQNLFGGELHPKVRACFEAGAGGELRGRIPAMSALHSSSAMAVNLFQYWVVNEGEKDIARLLGIPSTAIQSVAFERKYPVSTDWQSKGFTEPPHLDLGIDYSDHSRVGVECKLFEPYGRLGHAPLKRAYLNLQDGWQDIPACRRLAEKVSGDANEFRRLDPAQLLRHLLGLKFGRATDKVRLVYLYYDAVGDEAAEHRQEVRRFEELISSDPVRFVPLSVQEFILRAAKSCGPEHLQYVHYICERYL